MARRHFDARFETVRRHFDARFKRRIGISTRDINGAAAFRRAI
jgi:hypothetical protein